MDQLVDGTMPNVVAEVNEVAVPQNSKDIIGAIQLAPHARSHDQIVLVQEQSVEVGGWGVRQQESWSSLSMCPLRTSRRGSWKL